MNRILHRRVDPETGETFPENFIGNTNPKTGNPLVVRVDDNEEAVSKRIQWSINESLPLIDIWEKDGYTVHRIDANRDIEIVFADIYQIINS